MDNDFPSWSSFVGGADREWRFAVARLVINHKFSHFLRATEKRNNDFPLE